MTSPPAPVSGSFAWICVGHDMVDCKEPSSIHFGTHRVRYLTTDNCVQWLVLIHWYDVAKTLSEDRRVVILIQHLDSQLNLREIRTLMMIHRVHCIFVFPYGARLCVRDGHRVAGYNRNNYLRERFMVQLSTCEWQCYGLSDSMIISCFTSSHCDYASIKVNRKKVRVLSSQSIEHS